MDWSKFFKSLFTNSYNAISKKPNEQKLKEKINVDSHVRMKSHFRCSCSDKKIWISSHAMVII